MELHALVVMTMRGLTCHSRALVAFVRGLHLSCFVFMAWSVYLLFECEFYWQDGKLGGWCVRHGSFLWGTMDIHDVWSWIC